MHSIQFSKPSEETKRFIRFYAHREARLGSSLLIHPIPARSEHALDFEFGGPIEIYTFDSGVTRTAETAALIGSQTHQRTQLLVRGNIESFTIFFQPTALNLLFGLPAIDITNHDYEAPGVLGCSIVDLKQRLGNCDSFVEACTSRRHLLPVTVPEHQPSMPSNLLLMRSCVFTELAGLILWRELPV